MDEGERIHEGKKESCLVEQGNTEDSEVVDSERQMLGGQRLSIIKSILQKMLKVQVT